MDTTGAALRKLTRWRASGIHLLISAALAVITLALMLLVWYPRPLFEAAGGSGLLFILIGVDVIIGPLITLIIFKSGKRGLRFDLCVIAVLQLGALLYGSHIMFVARPVFIALVKGQFEVVSAVEIPPSELAEAKRPEFRSLPLAGPVLVYSELDERERQEVIMSVLSGGPDVQHRPKYYVPYAERTKQALAQANPLDLARKTWPLTAQSIDRYLAASGRPAAEVVYLPGRAAYGWIAALLDAKTGEVLKILLVPEA
jgi:hypothetical protein